jgi:hypothetical protein
MSESEYDDTDMSPEEFEERMAATVPANTTVQATFVEPSTTSGSTTSGVSLPVMSGPPLAHVLTAADSTLT